jgi:hypothetical protein
MFVPEKVQMIHQVIIAVPDHVLHRVKIEVQIVGNLFSGPTAGGKMLDLVKVCLGWHGSALSGVDSGATIAPSAILIKP